MHIVQLANFHSPTSGGIKVALAQLATQYVAMGHRVTRIIPGPASGAEMVEGVTVLTLRAPQIPRSGGYRVVIDRRTLRDLVEWVRPDVLELSDRTTMLTVTHTARHLGAPTVLISHERLESVLAHVATPQRALRAAVRAYNRRVLARVDAVVCASQFAAEEYRGLQGAPVMRISLGVDLDRFHAGAGSEGGPDRAGRPDAAADGIRLVSVTRHSPEKDPHLAIATVRELVARGRVVSLDMVGTGPLSPDLRLAARGLPVVFHGHVADRAMVAALLASADVAIAPGPNETFGLAALEALACGTPVVVPTQGALREMLDGDLVGEVASSEGGAMADAVERLLARGDRAARRDACRARAEQFPWAATAASMVEVFTSLRRVSAAA